MSRVRLVDDQEIHEVVILDAEELGLVNIEIAFVGLHSCLSSAGNCELSTVIACTWCDGG